MSSIPPFALRMETMAAFVTALAATAVAPDAFNQYSHAVADNAVRRANLRRYLAQMAARSPRFLLVGEAPGYRGCRLTGVPFTSEAVLLADAPSLGLFGQGRGYRKTAESPHPSREATATIVWQTLANLELVPLLWNAFPFHPFRAGQPWSNRAPRRGELQQGATLLAALCALFPVRCVVAVGSQASAALTLANMAHVQVRHPSHGGKRAFQAGLAALRE